MRLEVTGRQVEITPTLRRLVERKLAKIDRKLKDAIVSLQVVLTKEKYRNLVEMTLHARSGHIMKAMANGQAWEASIGEAAEKLEQQAHTLKGKWTERKRRATPGKVISARTVEAEPEKKEKTPAAAADRPEPKIVHSSRYATKPMTVEEAALLVSDRDEAFVVFRNATTDSVNVLYRRRDGNLGLIEPEA